MRGRWTSRPRRTRSAAPARRAYNNSRALVVGIYGYEYLPWLLYAVNDSEAVARLLKEEFGFKDKRIFRRRDKEATKDEMDRVVERFINETYPDDRTIVCFLDADLARLRAEYRTAHIRRRFHNTHGFLFQICSNLTCALFFFLTDIHA